jgi:hypothetical protein
MSRSASLAPEFQERTIRLVAELIPSYGSRWAALRSVAAQLISSGVAAHWVRLVEHDAGRRRGLIRSDAARSGRWSVR